MKYFAALGSYKQAVPLLLTPQGNMMFCIVLGGKYNQSGTQKQLGSKYNKLWQLGPKINLMCQTGKEASKIHLKI